MISSRDLIIYEKKRTNHMYQSDNRIDNFVFIKNTFNLIFLIKSMHYDFQRRAQYL